MRKYQALSDYLARQDAAEIPMTFGEIEDMLGFTLPASARQFPAWWANQAGGGHSQCQAWLAKGWRTRGVDLAGERLIFARHASPADMPGVAEAGRPFHSSPPARALGGLSLMATRLLEDYRNEAGGDEDAAIARALHEAAVARRVRFIDAIAATGVSGGVDSVDLIREDRDAR
jgi:hypothetical protein